ncbi:MAG: hypothetical protein A2847_03070 [Candidatus Sungbacteria bacterium RIFCSPHIGHO2_01_FULL_50_25]|uniref:Small-conductance mechanosensitive ion channel n=1 Tax=Candidatus Sungbacteria bacterium RIFCSPHIGHO2_01_FULL_50_25 TaxID=1802265 RepID=A0A1G2K6N3_9BACT|nr:MAG: hypothetical protein A2847_03070 [Candidatus Sungbacteria bacterium RIFCSPHIGHO2_01_FULL_50_25]
MPIDFAGELIVVSLREVAAAFATFLPLVVLAVIVFAAGFFIAIVVGKAVEQLIRATKIDSLLSKLAFEQAVERAGWRLNTGAFIGGIIKWFIIVAFLLASVNILGERFAPISGFLRDVLSYLPNVVVSALILVIAAIIAQATERAVRGSVEAAGHRGAAAGVLIRWSIWVFAVSAALIQLGIAPQLIQTVMTGLVFAIAGAFALAFGLGGKDIATSALEKMKDELRK